MMTKHVATGKTSARDFIKTLAINFGPREVMSEFFLKADASLKERGVSLEFGTFDELLAVNELNRQHWLPLTPTFNCTFNSLTPDHSFCLLGRNEAGEVVATQACRRFDWPESSFDVEASALKIFYENPDRDRQSLETCMVTAENAKSLTGRVIYTGAVWYRPDYRGKGLATIMPRITRGTGYALWGGDYAIAMMSRDNVKFGLPQKSGHAHVDFGVLSRNSTHGDVDYYIASVTGGELVADLLGWSRGADHNRVHDRSGDAKAGG